MTERPDPFDRLHDALVLSATSHQDPEPSSNGAPGPRFPRRLGLLALGGLLVGGTAVAATAPWNPQIGPRDAGRAERPSLSQTAVPPEQLHALGVLRRGQTERDRSTPTEDLLQQLGTPGRGLRVGSVRLLRSTDGAAIVLTSIARLGSPSERPVVTNALCVSETTSPSDQAAAARSTIDTKDGPIPAPIAIGGSSCGSFQDLLRGRLRTVTTGLVPDGVARVRVQLTTGRVIEATVRDNFYELPIDAGAPGPSEASAATRRFRSVNGRRIDWVDGRGQVVRKNDVARNLRRTQTN